MLKNWIAALTLATALAGALCCSDCDCGCQNIELTEQNFACSDCKK